MKKPIGWRRPLGLTALLAFVLHGLRAFLLAPLKVRFGTDILYQNSILPAALDLLLDLTLMAVIYICYTFILETIFRQGLRRAIPLALLYLGGTVFGSAGNLIMDLTVNGGRELFGMLLLAVLSGIGQELLQLALVMLIACLLARGYTGPYVPQQMFSRQNRLQLAALLGAGVTALFRIGARVIYDISLGAPTATMEMVDMAINYAADLLIPFLGYLGMVLLMFRIPADSDRQADA